MFHRIIQEALKIHYMKGKLPKRCICVLAGVAPAIESAPGFWE